MSEILLAPPLAFAAYLLLVGLLHRLGDRLAARARPAPLQSSTYASGEAPPASAAPTGYRRYFKLALFFAVLHLGVLVLAAGGLTPLSGVFVLGLILALVVLMLG